MAELKTETKDAKQVKVKAGRSPAYPGIDLQEAISRARTIYQHEGKHPAPVEAIYRHWGYSPKSSPARVAIASVKYFGLIKSEGLGTNKEVQLSDLALDILLDERETSPERIAGIQKAALLPPIHAEIWSKYDGQLPSDESLRFYLTRTRGFTLPGATEFLKQFHATLAFAGLQKSDIMPESNGDKTNGRQTGEKTMRNINELRAPQTPPRPLGIKDIQLPLSTESWATLSAEFPLTQAKWEQLIAVLNAMKPALVATGNKANEPENET